MGAVPAYCRDRDRGGDVTIDAVEIEVITPELFDYVAVKTANYHVTTVVFEVGPHVLKRGMVYADLGDAPGDWIIQVSPDESELNRCGSVVPRGRFNLHGINTNQNYSEGRIGRYTGILVF